LTAHAPLRTGLLWGALSAAALVLPFAALCALVYRFPVPFGGYVSGARQIPLALLAVGFYGALGGLPLMLAVGALGGWAAHALAAPDVRRIRRLALAFGMVAAAAAVVLLAVLDKLIGPW
jgi:hypothetical protein